MEKNKSIDGLKPRRAPKTATKSTKTPKKSASKTKKPATSAKKPTKTTPKNPATPSTPPPTVTEDFLTPVQAFNFDEETGKLINAPKFKKFKPKKDKKKKPKMSKKKKIIITVVSILVLIIIGVVLWLNGILARITNQGNLLDLLFNDNYVQLKTDENGRTNILAFGTSGYNMEGAENGGIHDGAQLTDSIMIISLNQDTGDVAMLSLPRDLKASPTCTATSKINEVYWCNNMEGNNEEAGAEALMTEVSDITGVDFQYYAHLNWKALVQIVDSIGGIKVTLDEGIYDYGFTKAVYDPGVEYTLNGEEALGLARARHGTESGDFTRGNSQQVILMSIKDKVTSNNLSITDMVGLASTLGDNLRTSFSVEELKTVAHLAQEYDTENMRQVSLIDPEQLVVNGNINGISYVVPAEGIGNYGAIQSYVAKMFNYDPKVYEEPTVLVLNATKQSDAASSEKSALEKDGFTNVDTDKAPSGDYSGEYTLYILTDKKPGSKKLLEEKYHTSAKPKKELPANISKKYDFVLIIAPKDNN